MQVETLGQRLKRLRNAIGLTQGDLAKKAGCGQSTISGLENDTRPKRPDLIEIAHVLGVDAYYLRTGVATIIAGDRRINEVVDLMMSMRSEGRAIVLDKARDVAREYPLNNGHTPKKTGS